MDDRLKEINTELRAKIYTLAEDIMKVKDEEAKGEYVYEIRCIGMNLYNAIETLEITGPRVEKFSEYIKNKLKEEQSI